MKFLEIERDCPMCGNVSHVALTEKEFEGYMDHYMYNKLIQDAMPDIDPAVCEFVRSERTGYCHDCMESIFGRTSKRIVEGGEGFIDFFDLADYEFASVDEYLALEAEANALWSKNRDNETACIQRRDRITECEVIEASEHFVIVKSSDK